LDSKPWSFSEIWMYVGINPETGDEALAGFVGEEEGMWVPLVCGTKEGAEEMRGIAEQMAEQMKMELRLVQMTGRKTIDVIDGTFTPKAGDIN
jgi:hypothetical protein